MILWYVNDLIKTRQKKPKQFNEELKNSNLLFFNFLIQFWLEINRNQGIAWFVLEKYALEPSDIKYFFDRVLMRSNLNFAFHFGLLLIKKIRHFLRLSGKFFYKPRNLDTFFQRLSFFLLFLGYLKRTSLINFFSVLKLKVVRVK